MSNAQGQVILLLQNSCFEAELNPGLKVDEECKTVKNTGNNKSLHKNAGTFFEVNYADKQGMP